MSPLSSVKRAAVMWRWVPVASGGPVTARQAPGRHEMVTQNRA
ncbi:MAG TPA: hypothetical protein VMF13_01460 [Luteitalea sp.]|nr:hypothetical protein [Luteitalea sp.]